MYFYFSSLSIFFFETGQQIKTKNWREGQALLEIIYKKSNSFNVV